MDRAASTKRDVLERMLFDESIEPTDLPLSLLEYITDGFSDDKQIGRGGFAVVYKGTLRNGTIAVKKLELNTHLHENKFKDEVECLMKVKHKNIVRFLGYCADTQGKMERYNGKAVLAEVPQKLLCFEYLPKGSLHDFITDASSELEWTQCFQIIKGICAGLHCLHENRIVHLDLKPANILLDDNVVPKIADFGLSRCFDERQSSIITSNLCGTIGYIAPEVIYRGRITYKSDIYSLGVIINEIMSGKNMYLEDYDALKSWGNRLDKLHGEKQLEQLRVCTEIGKECTDFDQERRPDAQAIVRRLDEVDIIEDSRPDEADIVNRSTVLTDMSNLSIAQEEIHKVEEPGDGNQQLFGAIGRELSLKCLLRLSRSYYGTVASLNRNFQSLVRNGEIYHLRRLAGVAEHWIYVCTDGRDWKAYDLERRRWVQVPSMPIMVNKRSGDSIYFDTGSWQWLAVGTELLGFGKWNSENILLSYSILTNSWTETDFTHDTVRTFGSTSVGQKAYLAGIFGDTDHYAGAIYDSEKKVWEYLPRMNRLRKWCSAAFMDSKLYAIGGMGLNSKDGEEYDFERKSWRVIDDMLSEGLNVNADFPLQVAVVNNELYAADVREWNVKRYDKQNNRWITLGNLPKSIKSHFGLDFSFKACGDKLITIGRTSLYFISVVLYSCVPSEQPLAWNLIARHPSGSIVDYSAVMSC